MKIDNKFRNVSWLNYVDKLNLHKSNINKGLINYNNQINKLNINSGLGVN